MGSNTGGGWSSNFKQGKKFSVSINAACIEEADRLFNGLSIDGEVTIPMSKTFWCACFVMFTGKFGIN